MADRPHRRLAAVVAADVAGYSRLVGRDEEGTLKAMRAVRQEVVDPLLAGHGGRLANTAGDSLLIEFPSAVEAVRFALALQQQLGRQNAHLPDERRLRFRVGINVGDVMSDDADGGGDLFGDGVNVAARLEGLAPPGGVCISGNVHEHVQGRIEAEFEDLGEQSLKNISRPVRVWQWRPEGAEPAAPQATLPTAAGAGGSGGKPSIIVLPFANLSGDAAQEHVIDAITEDLIAGLSRLSGFRVFARGTAFAFKGRSVSAADLRRELGVDYVLEGSIRQAGDALRVSAQLSAAANEEQIWADRFDGSLDDIFGLQEQIARRIVATIQPELIRALASVPATSNTEAWIEFARGRRAYWRWEKDSLAAAERHVRRALDLDPDFAEAHAFLALLLWSRVISGFATSGRAVLEEAAAAARRALSLDENLAFGHVAMGIILLASGSHEGAIAEAERAVELLPGQSNVLLLAAYPLVYGGLEEKGMAWARESLSLNPRDPQVYGRYQLIATGAFALGAYGEALAAAKKVISLQPDWVEGRTFAIASLVEMERLKEACAVFRDARAKNPNYSVDYAVRRHPFARAGVSERLAAALMAAERAAEAES